MPRTDYTSKYPPSASELNYTNKVVNELTLQAIRINIYPDGTPVLIFEA